MADQQDEERIRKLYNEQFEASEYLDLIYKDVQPTEKVCLNQLYDTFDSGKLEGSVKRCLEIGCGPVVHRMAPVSKVCDTIVYADFSQLYRKAVKEWLDYDGPSPQYHHLFKYCADKESFQNTDEGIRIIEKRLKSKVKGVIPVDLRNPRPIGEVTEPYDVVFTCGCLEAACLNYEQYVDSVKAIAGVLRPGGYLIIRGFSGGDYYAVGEDKYPCLNQNVDMSKTALLEVGYKVLEADVDCMEEDTFQEMIREMTHKPEDEEKKEMTNFKGCFTVLAQKI